METNSRRYLKYHRWYFRYWQQFSHIAHRPSISWAILGNTVESGLFEHFCSGLWFFKNCIGRHSFDRWYLYIAETLLGICACRFHPGYPISTSTWYISYNICIVSKKGVRPAPYYGLTINKRAN